MHLRGWLSLHCLVVFLCGALIYFFIWAIFFLSWLACYVEGQSPRCSLGWGNAGCCAVMLYVGEGPRGSNGAAPLSTGPQSFTPLPTIKLGPSGADSQVGGWACAHSEPLWVSPMNSPVKLGVSPTAA